MAQVSIERVYTRSSAARFDPLVAPGCPDEYAYELALEAQRVVVEKILRLEAAQANTRRAAKDAQNFTDGELQFYADAEAELVGEYNLALEAQRLAVEGVLRSISATTSKGVTVDVGSEHPVRDFDIRSMETAKEVVGQPTENPHVGRKISAEEHQSNRTPVSDAIAATSAACGDEVALPPPEFQVNSVQDLETEVVDGAQSGPVPIAQCDAVPPSVVTVTETETAVPAPSAVDENLMRVSADTAAVVREGATRDKDYRKLEHFHQVQFQLQNAYDIPLESRGDYRAIVDAIRKDPSAGSRILKTRKPLRDYQDWSKSSSSRLNRLAYQQVQGMSADQKLQIMEDVEVTQDALATAYGVISEIGELTQAMLSDNSLAKSVLKTDYPLGQFLVMKRVRNALAHPKMMEKLKKEAMAG